MYSGSALAAALTAYTDAQNDDTPNVSPSNKTIAVSAACLEDGTEVVLDQEQANTVNSFGVATWLNMNGFRLWGQQHGGLPRHQRPEGSLVQRPPLLTWAANTFILTYFQKVDSPRQQAADRGHCGQRERARQRLCGSRRAPAMRSRSTRTRTPPLTCWTARSRSTSTSPRSPLREDIEDIIEFDPDALSAALNWIRREKKMISNNYIPEKINEYNAYLDGTKMIGVAASVTLPEVNMKTSTVSGVGVNGELDSPTIGQFESMEQEIQFNTLYSSAMDMLSPCPR